ncbi:MAG TPA: DegT/DnrJ/EryC1/StrS family aminotransferase [Candidatus Syntrophosphaera sp.]|jgi:dTDP-4-amino-4,6-dideoxygalactose transaminase|nr:DegT/DnrJ/EryC1/StrS family aminotransferase [Candidatus Syntrophosphaera sp.]
MIPYYSPNFGIGDLIKTAICRNSEQRLVEYFRQLTQKEHILITSSCRSALYLAYKSLEKNGVVHVSPLTCQVALIPITAAGNQICFHDVQAHDWTLDPASVAEGIQDRSIAIQAIHLGGFPCDMPELKRIALENGLVLIEDCAQCFGSSYQGQPVGTVGDISCFTLTKNVFGLGGGVMATNNREYYDQAKAIQEGFDPESPVKLINRVLSGLVASGRNNPCNEYLYQRLTKTRQAYRETHKRSEEDVLLRQVKKPSGLYTASVASRMSHISRLNRIRQQKARQMIRIFTPLGFTFQTNARSESSYTKLFCYHPDIQAEEFIRELNFSSIEAMHLEHRHKVFYQTKQTIERQEFSVESGQALKNYSELHDHLVSLPLHEKLSAKDINRIQHTLQKAVT